ncbi:hypothetical protein SLS55_008386 [Diplodia seriata]|uniref:Uncharacterized protein n=1 Tax=Diplodia seriata TaxID=420778 RepID=A0ABR3CAD0_9PEZI
MRLGGVRALIQLSESTDASYNNILGSLKGVLFFGVPNQGMNIESLLPMVGSNPYLQLLQTIGEKLNPAFLHDQAQRFQMILDAKEFPIVSFYETKMSPTAVFVDGRWQMSGPPEVLVNPTSARHGRSFGSDVVPVNKSHSDMVKFDGPQDTVYYLVLHKLQNMREDGSWDQFHDRTRRVMKRIGKTYASFFQLREENPNPNARIITGNTAMNIVFVPWVGFTLVVFFVMFWGGVFYGVKSLVNGTWTGPLGDA